MVEGGAKKRLTSPKVECSGSISGLVLARRGQKAELECNGSFLGLVEGGVSQGRSTSPKIECDSSISGLVKGGGSQKVLCYLSS